MYILGTELIFPPVDEADEDGFLAVGGDLSPERLLLAYSKGIFPWYNEDEPICWWSPDPRCVLFPKKLSVSKSMKSLINKEKFMFSLNACFEQVLTSCGQVTRRDSIGTWINNDMVAAYTRLYSAGYAISAEAWENGMLAGGLYGVKIGNIFFGESMFSRVSNASKFAFIKLVQHLSEEGIVLIDCQQRTAHLESLGAEMMERKLFISLLKQYC